MSSFRYSIIVMVVFSLTAVGWAEREPADLILRLTLDLADGSRIMGVPSIKSVPVQTPYAKMDIPLKQIVNIKVEDDHETASFELQNGDTLTGVLDLGAMELKTSFGSIRAPVHQLQVISVRPAGMPHGLLLWNRLDGNPSLAGPNVEFLSKEGFVQGKVGRAVQVAGNNEWGFRVALDKLRNTPRGTIEYWMKVITKPPTVSHGSGPLYTIFTGGPHAQ